MAFSLDEIKLFKTVDLDNFAIRGAKAGINNAKSTGPLYDSGEFYPLKTILYGDSSVSSGDSTVRNISFDTPNLSALDLVSGDLLIVRADTTLMVSSAINSSSVAIFPDTLPAFSGTCDSTYKLADRDFLIEPDVGNNTISTDNGNGEALFTNGSTQVLGQNTQWLTDMTAGDSIQLNTYQKYFLVDHVVDDTTCVLSSQFDTDSIGFQSYTAKKWRLGRLDYRFVKQNFTYNNQKAKWLYDTTTGSNLIADSTFSDFTNGIDLRFTQTLNPAAYPDLMDSNVVLGKTFTRSTENDMYQYPLPAVPVPEESLKLYINGSLKDRYPSGNKDYVINYSQMPTYEYPPALSERTVANVMFLKGVQNVSLDPALTSSGVINFTDGSGNSVAGVMPGSETLWIDGTDQTANQDYVMDVNAGIAYVTELISSESVAKYVNYKVDGLYDTGINISKDGTAQVLTIPGKDTDDVLFEYESGRLKPIDKDKPGPGETYIVNYHTEGEYVSNEPLQITASTDWVRTSKYPLKYQSVILSKNGVYIDEGVDFRISYLTGRIVFFQPLLPGDILVVSYSPLIAHKNGLSNVYGNSYCTVYDATVAVASISPIAFEFPNSSVTGSAIPQSVYNATKAAYYDTTGYAFSAGNLQLVSDSTNLAIGTEFSDVVVMSYKFPSEGVEYAPVETINFVMNQGSNFIALVNQNSTSLFPSGTIVRLTNVDSAGDFYFRDASAVYDGEDTLVYFYGTAPSDIINPEIYISDNPTVLYISPSAVPNPITSGSTDIIFPGSDISRTFRSGQLMTLDSDIYSIQGSEYDSSARETKVTLGVQTYKDYTDAGILSGVTISDIPFYTAGDTVISTSKSIIVDPLAPVMSMTYDGYATVTKDASALSVTIGTETHVYLDSVYLYPIALASQLNSELDFTTSVTSNAYFWSLSKLVPVNNLVVTKDSSTVLSAVPSLRINSVDTTDFSIIGGTLVLNNPLVPGPNYYNLDYMGLKPLGDSTVSFSGSYFTYLPAKSEVKASMQYINLDQFYIQVMSERNFLDGVITPKKKEEANQQNGNVGQGGDLPGDEGGLNSTGGIAGDEYRRVDQSIECVVFDKIFDFFNGRVQAYGDEFYAALGYKICNNDGLLSETDQSAGTLPINRMFPWGDYTNYAPYTSACLTGQTMPYAVSGPKRPPTLKTAMATFTPGVTVTAYPPLKTYWTHQLKTGDLIRPYDSTKNYEIATVNNDSTLILKATTPYDGPTTVVKPFIMTSNLPLYDDDGFMGAKIIGNQTDDFGLVSGDVFNVQVDGSNQSYTFQDPPFPISLFFSVDKYTPAQIATLLNINLTGIKMSYGWTYDPTSSYGYMDAFTIRTADTSNVLILKSGSAVSKLGFTPDTTAWGNFDTTHSSAEYFLLLKEVTDRSSEQVNLATLINYPNKMDRTRTDAGFGQDLILNTIKPLWNTEINDINLELQRLGDETDALNTLLLEPTMSGYSNSLLALGDATTFINDCTSTKLVDQSLVSNYQGAMDPYIWALDIAYDSSVIPLYDKTAFTLNVPVGVYDKRVLDAVVNSIPYNPDVRYYDNVSALVDGTWSGYDPASGNTYSQPNSFTFFQSDRTDILYLNQTDNLHTHAYYVDNSGLYIIWDTVNTVSFPYNSLSPYYNFNNLRSTINSSGIPSLVASGTPAVNSYAPGFKPVGTALSPIPISPDATVLPALRDINVSFKTIDSMYLMDRSAFDTTRLLTLADREAFLLTRETQIRSDMTNDGYFRTAGNCPSNLYVWANNLYNRSNGSWARLNQIQKQIDTDRKAVENSKMFSGSASVPGVPSGPSQCRQTSGF